MHLPRPGNAFPYVQTARVRSRKAQSRDPIVSNVVQAHPLLPPPPPRHRTVPLVCPLAFRKDAASDHILRDRLHSHIDVMPDCVHPTLLQHLIRGWVDPLLVRPPPRHMLLRHPICRAEMESLEPGQDGRAQNSRLASVQEDGLHDRLVELGAYSWGRILPSQHLPDPCPRPARLAELDPHGLDVAVILREQAAKVPKHLDPLQHVSMHRELLAQGKC